MRENYNTKIKKQEEYTMLTPKDIASMLDHSTLQQFLTDEDIRKGCEIAIKYGTATVCARPQDMKLVSSLLAGSSVKPCTVIGFPHGAHLTAVKVFEARQALADGCVRNGLPRNLAYKMVSQAVLGSAKMVLETGMHPGALKDMVCSPGGTTIEGLAALEENNFRGAIIKACDANFQKNKLLK